MSILGKFHIFWIFVIGCIFGTYYEQILTLVKSLIHTGEFVWEFRRGVLYGPFSPIYGAGAVLMILLLGRKKNLNKKSKNFYSQAADKVVYSKRICYFFYLDSYNFFYF